MYTPAALPVPPDTVPLINTVPFVEFVIVSSFSNITPVDPVISTDVLAVMVINAPVDAEFAPIAVPSIAPPSTSTLDISTSPLPLGVIAIFPFAPSVIVIDPVVEFPVCIVTS